MSSTPDPGAVMGAAFAALRQGRAAEARDLFSRLTSAGAALPDAWFGLARALAKLGDEAGEMAALDGALAADPRHLPSLIAKGDAYARREDLRAADTWYMAVSRLAATLPNLPPDARREVQRVEAERQRISQTFERHLLDRLSEAGLGAPGSERFAHAVDLLLGRRQIFLQQPRHFYFPELPQRQFFEREEFPWATALEDATDAIRSELRGVLSAGVGMSPYLEASQDRPNFDTNGLLGNPDWSAFYLIRNGEVVGENVARCPATFDAIQALPLCRIDGRTPSVLFSILKPGTRIPPHSGFMNARLICHLPLIVPKDCGALRVGNETRPWTEGRLMVFDDSIEHEAWNSSAEVRVVLIFDIWRPELTDQERTLIAGMLSAINGFSGGAWSE